MWPWDTEPKSVAHGILDDETYDWLAVCEGMLLTGGYPLVVEEETLVEANRVARETTGIDVDHTGLGRPRRADAARRDARDRASGTRRSAVHVHRRPALRTCAWTAR